MKRLLLAAIAVVALAAAVPALAAPSPKATGNVDWAYGQVTGNVTFTAQGTPADAKGDLTYTDSTGGQLHGLVTWYKQINPTSAYFGGTITDGSPAYMVGDHYFVAKVVDNGSSGTAGDKIAVWANVGPESSPAGDPIGSDLAGVTGGNLVVH
jgi:hypothetical protein